MMENPIFIVGVPRSGTTLLAAMLAAHSRLSCGPETHFFRWLSGVQPAELCQRNAWPDPAVSFVCSIEHSFLGNEGQVLSKRLVDKYQIDEREIHRYLANREPSIANILASITEQYMIRLGKRRWVDKTPDHIKHVRQIRTHFPDSPILRIVRDPRDVALSLSEMPWGAKTFLDGLLWWQRNDEASRQFLSTDGLCYTLRFEDLILSPREELQKLCQFIEEEFEEDMLDTSITGKGVNSMNVPWKDKASQPVDPDRVRVWSRKLTRKQNQLAESLLGDRLGAYGYPRKEDFVAQGDFYPSSDLIWKYKDELESLAATGVRMWTDSDEIPTAKIYVGDPGNYHWLGEKKDLRLVNFLYVSAEIGKAIVCRSPVYWIPDPYSSNWTGYCAYVLKKLLASREISMAPSAVSSRG